jgi:hypothetical protein
MGHGPPPLWQYFSPLPQKKGRRLHYGPQRARTPNPGGLFPCKPAVFRGPPEGAMIAVVDPQASRLRDGWAKAMPLWQYFPRLQTPTSAADGKLRPPTGLDQMWRARR